jgi:hypothetical protein
MDTASAHRASPTTISLDPTLAALEQEDEETTTKVKNISKLYMGWLGSGSMVLFTVSR